MTTTTYLGGGDASRHPAPLLAAAGEVRATRTWTGLAGSGRMALIDHRRRGRGRGCACSATRRCGAHHDLTDRHSCRGRKRSSCLRRTASRPTASSSSASPAPAYQRCWAAHHARGAILAGQNDYTIDSFQMITGRPPRPVVEFLHDHRAEFI